MSLSISDQARPPTGEFLLHVFRAGVLIETLQEKNLIVDNSKLIHAKLLGGDVANMSITQAAFGTNGTAPSGGNTAITGAFNKTIDSHTYPATNQVTFNFSLGASEGNGMAIAEFGLITAGGMLYARKVRTSPLAKESDISLAVAWTINF